MRAKIVVCGKLTVPEVSYTVLATRDSHRLPTAGCRHNVGDFCFDNCQTSTQGAAYTSLGWANVQARVTDDKTWRE